MRVLAFHIGGMSTSVFENGWAQLQATEPAEAERVLKFRVDNDRKRALAGRLLWRRICAELPGPLEFRRTPENKPYVATDGNFNFNVTHHGDWVVAASDANALVGVDVMRYDEPLRGRSVFFESMRGQFTPEEWRVIGDDIRVFYRFWALKESYIKAVGIGLGFNLQRASFSLPGGQPGRATLCLDGVDALAWDFVVLEVDSTHCVAVARGPFAAAHWDFRRAPGPDDAVVQRGVPVAVEVIAELLL